MRETDGGEKENGDNCVSVFNRQREREAGVWGGGATQGALMSATYHQCLLWEQQEEEEEEASERFGPAT